MKNEIINTIEDIFIDNFITDAEQVSINLEKNYSSVVSVIMELKDQYRILVLGDIFDIPLILRKDATIDDVFSYLAETEDLSEEEIETIEYYYEEEFNEN